MRSCLTWNRYHSKCLKIARGKVKEDDDFVCPICDWRVKIPRDADRPKLEELLAWQAEIAALPFQPDEEEMLASIINTAQAFREYLTPFTSQTSGMVSTMEEVPTQQFYLRKLEGADVLLAYETNFFRQELHRLVPHAPEPPPIIELSKSTRKPRPTKQQKLMAQLGIDNPDDLPVHLRTKPFNAKKRGSEEQKAKSDTPGSSNGKTGHGGVNFKMPVTAESYHHKHQHSLSHNGPQPHLTQQSPSDLAPGGPFRQAGSAATLPQIGSPPAFGKGITASPPRHGASLDYTSGLELSAPHQDGRAWDRMPYDAFTNNDGGQTSNFDSMFADLTNNDDGQDGQSNTSGGHVDPSLL